MPAEWSPHDACLMAWPPRRESWGTVFDRARREYAAVADTIARFEPVIMVAAPGAADEVRRWVTASIDVVELPIDEAWMRDSGPLFVLDEQGNRAGADFIFNSWGQRFIPYDDDARISERVLEHLGIPRHPWDMVLEGGSIAVDGEGTLITTEQCLLRPNRNPTLGRVEIEQRLQDALGARTVIWLPFGHADDLYTDGHVEGVCAFVRPGTVIVQACEDRSHPDHERMAANSEVLRACADASGRRLEIIEMPLYPHIEVAGERKSVSYLNFYVANGGVVVPVAGHTLDHEALEILARAFPEREVVGVAAGAIAYGGGGVHCITQQIPSAQSRAAAVG